MNNETLESKIIEKIKKLLELSTSPNEHEAARAMDMAQRMMLKYSIEHDQISQSNHSAVEIKEVEYYNELFKRPGVFEQIPAMLVIIAPIFGVHGLRRTQPNGQRYKYFLFGFPVNIEIAKFALDSLLNQGMMDAREGYRKFRTVTFSQSFWSGFGQGLKAKFHEANSASKGIELYDKVKAKVDEISKGKTCHSREFDGVAFGEGYDSGQRAELRRALTTKNEGKLIG